MQGRPWRQLSVPLRNPRSFLICWGRSANLAIMAGNYQKPKQQAIDKPTESNAKKKSKKKSKKEKLEQKKKVDDLFGVAEAGEYDHYEDQYDDFF